MVRAPSPLKWISPAYLPTGLQDLAGKDLYAPGWHFGFNIPAFLVVMVLTVVLVRGIRESARTNNILVLVKIVAILAFIFAAASFIKPVYWHPFMPNGWTGMLSGGSIIFFTYIGFDSVSTAAEECKQPAARPALRHPGHAGSLHAALRRSRHLSQRHRALAVHHGRRRPGGQRPQAPLAPARRHNLHWVELIVLIGAMLGMISSILVFQLGQARVWFAMSRDGLLPKVFGKIHPRFRTPAVATWVAGFVVGIPAGLLDIGTVSNLSNIGTLFAFVLVSIAVLILRYREPERHRAFRAPLGPSLPRAQHHLLHRADDGPRSTDMGGVLHLADRRPDDLLLLQPPPQRVRSSTLRNDRSQRTRSVIGP